MSLEKEIEILDILSFCRNAYFQSSFFCRFAAQVGLGKAGAAQNAHGPFEVLAGRQL